MKLLFCILVSFYALSAQAGLMLEPALTYEKSDNTLSLPAPLSSSTGSGSGVGLALKAGWDFGEWIYLAADAMLSSPNFKNSSVDYDADASSNLYAGILGVKLPLGIRAWGGYVFDGALDPKSSNGYDVSFKKANGLKLGAGFKILFISLNLEYMDLQYDDSHVDMIAGVSTDIKLDQKFKNKVYVFSVSLPVTF